MVSAIRTDDRGVTPVVYVALLAVIIIGVSGVAVTVGFDVIDVTSDKLADTGVELDNIENKEVMYTGNKMLHEDNIDSLTALSEQGGEVTIYHENSSKGMMNEELNGTIEKGDMVFNGSAAVEGDIDFGEEVTFIAEMNSGDTYTIGAVTLPPRDYGSGTHGDVGVGGGDFNVTMVEE